ncbi:Alpha/Beta hydrolase protein [Aspergillus floccosus]
MSKRPFPPPTIHPPQPTHNHTHTIILLHGRGSHGAEFASEFLPSQTSASQTLASSLPTWRWVFPTARTRWSTTFQEDECAWFDAASLTDIHARQDLQTPRLRESLAYVLDILDREVALLGGRAERLFLGGMSQGMATALWVLFCAARRVDGPLGGFVGFCWWLPFARQVEGFWDSSREGGEGALVEFFYETLEYREGVQRRLGEGEGSVLSTPVFLSHGSDDPWVSVELGRQAHFVLSGFMGRVEWSEFSWAEGDGHWVKEPEGFDDILRFLERCSGQT